MIYSPAHYKETDTEAIYSVIREHSFATIITQSTNGPFISHLPLLLELVDNVPTLIGHCAKANPQWKHFTEGQTLTALFHGPHSYISPAWYHPKPDNVPTWNYAAVHITGQASIVSEPTLAFEVLKRITTHFENEYKTGWSLPELPSKELSQLLNHIVAFRIEIKDIQAKFKLSQKQNLADRKNVIKELSIRDHDQQQVAELMSATLPAD